MMPQDWSPSETCFEGKVDQVNFAANNGSVVDSKHHERIPLAKVPVQQRSRHASDMKPRNVNPQKKNPTT